MVPRQPARRPTFADPDTVSSSVARFLLFTGPFNPRLSAYGPTLAYFFAYWFFLLYHSTNQWLHASFPGPTLRTPTLVQSGFLDFSFVLRSMAPPPAPPLRPRAKRSSVFPGPSQRDTCVPFFRSEYVSASTPFSCFPSHPCAQ